MPNHGIFVYERATSVSAPIVAKVGIPFFIGAAPVQSAETPEPAEETVLCTSWEEAVEKLGYSEQKNADGTYKYSLCECMYSHFNLFGRQPAIFCNMLDPATMSVVVAPENIAVDDHKAKLPVDAVNDDASLLIKEADGGAALVRGVDYEAYYAGENLIIELLPDGGAYSASEINAGYKTVTPASVTPALVATGLQNIEKCLTSAGIVPDLIAAPGYSHNPTVAAVMATKAAGINGIFRAKALVDISTSEDGGARSYTAAIACKKDNNLIDENQIVCWPLVKLGDHVFHMSTQLAGLIATVDSNNEGCPYESPSNKALKCNGLAMAGGGYINLIKAQADILNANGIVTALNFMSGWTAWGNYTGCYPANADVKDFFIPISRMFDWIGNTVIRTFWAKLDKPMNTRLVGNIMDTCNIWLNGLKGSGYILGARVEVREDENPLTDLMAGIVRVHIYATPPPPAQEIDFILEYDVNYVASALA